jgi:uncharacterized protein (DUF1697 family)
MGIPTRSGAHLGDGQVVHVYFLTHQVMICSGNTMTTYILLVRGVTPSGRNKLSMARFRETLEQAGFAHVRTYIQSGNALVDTDFPAHTIEKSVRDLIRTEIGPDLSVLARTGSQLEEALEENPFTEGYDISRVFFVLFAETPPADKVRELLSLDLSPEKLAFGKNTAYMYIPGVYGRGTLSGNFLEKKLGVTATMRNFNTMNRLVTMSREIHAQQ